MIRLIALVALVTCWAGGVLAQGSPDLSARAFTERVAAGLAAKLPGSKTTVAGDLQITIRRAEGSEIMLSVRNLYQDYKSNPANIGAIIDAYAAGLAEQRPARAAAKLDATRIVPVIKDRQWLEDNRQAFRAKAPDFEFLFEDFNDQLVIVYAEDTASRTRYLMANEDTGIDRAALRQRAVDNLLRLLPKIEVRNHDDVFSLISAGGDYEASLLLADIWRDGQIKVDGDIVVAIPAKDVLLVTGSKNRKGLSAVRKLAAELAGQGRYRLTDALFVYRNGRFVKFGR